MSLNCWQASRRRSCNASRCVWSRRITSIAIRSFARGGSRFRCCESALQDCPDDWRVLFEYPLLRLGRRIDTVLLTGHAIIVLEFKIGATSITTLDRQQTEDYALDLFDFHAASRGHPIVPILVATQARAPAPEWPLLWFAVTGVFVATAAITSDRCCATSSSRIPKAARALDARAWEAAPYRPVPTIVEAATMLYNRHGVADIAEARADVGNLGRTTDAISHAVEAARMRPAT